MEQERILIVEDEKIIALDLRRRLEKFGYKVVGTSSRGDEAVSVCDSERPDLVLMDIMLSGGDDGVVAATEIKDRFQIPVVFLTAYADEATLQRAKIAEPIGYVLKPFKERELYSTIGIGLYKSRADRALLKQERLFSAILHSVGDGIISTDGDGLIQFMNPTAETLTGWREENAKGEPLETVFALVDDPTEMAIALPAPGTIGTDRARMFQSAYLRNRYGAQIHVEGSLAETHGDRGQFEGQTLAFRDVTDLKRLNETVTYQASHDALTGLLNRDELAARLRLLAEGARKEDRHHSFMFIDIDQFKVINDVCGHAAGDELLRQHAEDIQALLEREYVLGRLGGDEFGLIVLDETPESGQELAETIVSRLNRKFVWQSNSYNITVSVGLASISQENSSVIDIMAAADDACALAKEHGGNMVRAYQQKDNVFLKRKGEMQWIARLTSALDEDRFVPYSQEICPLGDAGHDKIEILLRLRDRDGSLVQPGEFITAAERYKLMPSIDKWVINTSFEYVKEQRLAGIDPPIVCVNLSGSSLADTTLMDYILEMMDKHEVAASHFCFEVTETSAIQNFARATVFVDRLKAEGATFALDDFGNGFSSFAYLKRLSVDYLKIDGSFVKDIEENKIDRAMVEAVNNIGHTMGMLTIAEYVHNEAVRSILTDMGVDYGQGFAISRPAPLRDEKKAETKPAE
jgi:diguanylate cyclase (GGDEF)-like protein/PAS domain S-box-containing protein